MPFLPRRISSTPCCRSEFMLNSGHMPCCYQRAPGTASTLWIFVVKPQFRVGSVSRQLDSMMSDGSLRINCNDISLTKFWLNLGWTLSCWWATQNQGDSQLEAKLTHAMQCTYDGLASSCTNCRYGNAKQRQVQFAEPFHSWFLLSVDSRRNL